MDERRNNRHGPGQSLGALALAAGDARVLAAPVWIDGLAPDVTPHRLRVTLDPRVMPGPGSAVRVRLNPPPPPVSPGADDFARDAWFQGIGG